MPTSEIITICTTGLPDGTHVDRSYCFEVDTSTGRICIESQYKDFGEYEAVWPEQEAWIETLESPRAEGGLYQHYFLKNGRADLVAFLRLLEPVSQIPLTEMIANLSADRPEADSEPQPQ